MKRNVLYWGATALVAIEALVAGASYVMNAPGAVENFQHVGYPQQLRILLGYAKLAGAVVLLMPRLPRLKEWAYAGFTFMWVAAFIAHYVAGDGVVTYLPLVLLGCLATSYATRDVNRRTFPSAISTPIATTALGESAAR